MTPREKRCKIGTFIFVLGYFVIGYMIINWISSSRDAFVDVSIAADYSVPFLAPFIFGYILVYLSIALIYLAIDDIESWGRAVVACTLATTVAYIIFLTIPVRMDMRPELATTGGINIAITRIFYAIDLPYNCFPSLHVTYPTLATLLTWRDHRVMRVVFLAMTLIVAASVILVKQHYFADVLAGFANACICFWVANKTKRYWIGWFRGNSTKTA